MSMGKFELLSMGISFTIFNKQTNKMRPPKQVTQFHFQTSTARHGRQHDMRRESNERGEHAHMPNITSENADEQHSLIGDDGAGLHSYSRRRC
jgi:hypothetical protein